MFSWLFPPKCPVDDDVRRWIEWRTAWLMERFPRTRLFGQTQMTPRDDVFRLDYGGTWDDACRLLDIVCDRMGVDPSSIELVSFTSDELKRRGQLFIPDILGFYSKEDGRHVVGLDERALSDPLTVVATWAHELAHFLLLGGDLLSEEEEDHEFLTDLLATHLGFGVFLANNEVYFQSSDAGWSAGRRGYFVYPAFGYALALWTRLSREPHPTWARALRLDVKTAYRQGLRWMHREESRHGRTVLADAEGVESVPLPEAFKPGGLRSSGCGGGCGCGHDDRRDGDEASDEGSCDAHCTDEPVEFEPTTPDEFFTRAVMHRHMGQDDHALADFDEAIRLGGDEAAFYYERAAVRSLLGDYAAALDDVQSALERDSEELSHYLLRARIEFMLQRHEAALEDLDWLVSVADMPDDRDIRAEAHHLRARVFLGTDRFADAYHDATAAIRKSPAYKREYYELRAEACDRLGEHDRARRDRDYIREAEARRNA